MTYPSQTRLTHLERRIIRHQLTRYPLPEGVSAFRYLREMLRKSQESGK